MPSWTEVESNVRQYAQYIWNRNATPDRIGGVNFDCVIKVSERDYIIIEITKNNTLEKIRTDVSKIQSVRMNLMMKFISLRPYIICDFTPTQGMRDAGKDAFIDVISFDEFKNMFFNFPNYNHIRSSKQFGSAIDPLTGENDSSAYTRVGYKIENGSEIDIDDICDKIVNGEKVVLLGDYGSGKSRCFREVFHLLSNKSSETLLYPIAIDLKETWGLESAVEIIRRHFKHLGMSEDDTNNVVKAHNSRRLCFLLDGFDEIGSRPWSEDKKTLELLRKHALQGVKDLISKTNAGCLISGRDHYFNSNEEMFSALGISKSKVLLARCKDEFNIEEFTSYLKINNIDVKLPEWLPKKPLVLKTIASLETNEISSLFNSSNGDEIGFWFKFIDAMCERDSRIHAILDPETVKNVLVRLARITRDKPLNFGPLTESEVVNVFHEVTGTYPNEQSTVMLQRLPGLGRVSSETSDRNFVDSFILDGLRAIDLAESIEKGEQKLGDLRWLNPLQNLGSSILASLMSVSQSKSTFTNYIKNSLHKSKENKISISDCISAIGKSDGGEIDFNNMIFTEPHFGYLDLEKTNIKNIELINGIFETITLGKIPPPGVLIKNCDIENLNGVSSSTGVPLWIVNCTIKNYQSVDTLTAIKKSGLSKAQTILVSILIKVYRQAGNGRKEHTLTKGLTHVDKKSLGIIIRYLITNGYLDTSKDNGELIYKPVRKHQGKIERILVELDRSNDSIWNYVSTIKDH